MNFLRQRTVAGSVAILLLATFAVTFYGFHATSEDAEAIKIKYTYKGITLEADVSLADVWQVIKDFIAWVDSLFDGNDCNADGNGCSCDPCECES